MMNISSSEAFLIFAKWRDFKPQIQLMRKPAGEVAGTPASIILISEKDESIDVEIVLNGQKTKCRFDLRGASFSYGEPADSAVFPEFAEGKWASYLDAQCPSGTLFIFAEREGGRG
jgi:hypothetical protein